ncbi:hypothetical protein [Streptacidiphilus neutrinimicus]|uniref:hypothetical protein n=1 Tax=Streptacidiphilus neutrinimicus TaxID=105420 RepID=UPI000A5E9CC9|nr:hypothetical protein [Streptacidiphilus neutrinimicus]
MFDTHPAPHPSLNQDVPDGWPVRLRCAAAPAAADPCSTRRRDALVAMADGTWEEAVVWAWTWNGEGRPVEWRCQIEVGGHVRWYLHDESLIRTLDPR